VKPQQIASPSLIFPLKSKFSQFFFSVHTQKVGFPSSPAAPPSAARSAHRPRAACGSALRGTHRPPPPL